MKELREIERAKAAFEEILRETIEQRAEAANANTDANNLPPEQNNADPQIEDNLNTEDKL